MAMMSRSVAAALRRHVVRRAPAAVFARRLSYSTDENDYETERLIFPRERPGLDYKLNWSLNADDVTPKHDAWRNADTDVLDKAKGSAPQLGEVDILEAGDTVPFETFDAYLAEIKAELEDATLYVEDGVYKEGGFAVRVISDVGDYAKAAKPLLNQDGVGWPFQYPVIVYAASKAEPFTGVQFQGSAKGVSGAIVAIGGAPASAIKETLSFTAKALAEGGQK